MREFHVLSLGAGRQSTALYCMIADGEITIPLNAAVFSDTQEEEDHVYRHLDWLRSIGGPPIVTVTVGKLGDDLRNGRNGLGQSFASIPAFTAFQEGGAEGRVPRQCTMDYKIAPIEQWIRRELIGLEPKQRMPSDVLVHQYMGFSRDEPGRAARTKMRFKQIRWGDVDFPLFNEGMTTRDCIRYNEKRVPHPVGQSACVFCPLGSNKRWRWLRDNNPAGWKRAVEVDRMLREEGSIVNVGMVEKLYIHRQCVPLESANLNDDQADLFDTECEGGCGL